MSSSRPTVHVTVQGLYEACRAQALEEVVASTAMFDEALARHARGWTRPSADEAVITVDAPWGRRAPLDWAESLKADVSQTLGLPASVGIAGSRLAARTCARLARPSGILLWTDGRESSLIEGLPLEELDELRADQLARLRSRGVKTIDELARLDPRTSRELLGSEGDKLMGLARGADADAGGAPRPSSVTRRPRQELSLLARRLARRLESASSRARGLELRLRFEDGVVRERYSLLPQPTAERRALLASAERLFALCPSHSQPLAGMSLSATGLTAEGGQLHLFGAPPKDIVVCVGRLTVEDVPESDPEVSPRSSHLTPAPLGRYPRPTFPGGTYQ